MFRIFLASGLGKDKSLEEAVVKLGGGEIWDSSTYDDKITHMLAGQVCAWKRATKTIFVNYFHKLDCSLCPSLIVWCCVCTGIGSLSVSALRRRCWAV